LWAGRELGLNGAVLTPAEEQIVALRREWVMRRGERDEGGEREMREGRER
jgi:hypothetical protein